ncbi:hypothetical protein ACFYY3_01045 [Streptomyces sp. NPDC001812]|uniref:hypothetical protein n=1 Tax=Streptomyces sp. NPDC001812 TaxID=3364611 RepID=UPI0036B2E5AB
MPPKQKTSVQVDPLEGDDAGRASSVAVAVEPDDRPDLTVTFDYVALPGEILGPFGVHITPRERVAMGEGWKLAGDPPRLGVAILRDLPIARWERAARLAAQLHPSQQAPWGWEATAGQEDIVRRAEEVVRVLHPSVDPMSGKAGARKWAKLTRFAQVILQHQQAQLAGAADPVGSVAEIRGVTPATVRSWLYRAKLEGITPESVAGAAAD